MTGFCFAPNCSGDVEKLRKLLDNKIDPNQGDYDRRTALHVVKKMPGSFLRHLSPLTYRHQAAAEGHAKVVELLISSKAHVNSKDRLAMPVCIIRSALNKDLMRNLYVLLQISGGEVRPCKTLLVPGMFKWPVF